MNIIFFWAHQSCAVFVASATHIIKSYRSLNLKLYSIASLWTELVSWTKYFGHTIVGVHLKPCIFVDFYMAYISQPIREDYHLYLLIRLAGMCTPCRNLRKYKASGVPLVSELDSQWIIEVEVAKEMMKMNPKKECKLPICNVPNMGSTNLMSHAG